ncbi:MAG: malto-oligosyltrehalose synthase [Isosphaeraceae bacterium]
MSTEVETHAATSALESTGLDHVRTPDRQNLARELFEAEKAACESSPPRRPVSTYRLQLHAGLTLRDVERVVDYLARLGISDLYLSPYLAARKGSTHGYDVIDHGRINPEVGDESDHQRLLEHLAKRGMGRVLDIVPNHMGFSPTNLYMVDVLENGPRARWACFFDIDWSPVKESLEGRILLPILEDSYGTVLESGLLSLVRDGGSFWIAYRDRRLPLRPRSYATVLDRLSEEFASRFPAEDEEAIEYLSIRDAARRLPASRFSSPEDVALIRREKEVIKRRLAALCQTSARVEKFVDDTVASFAGTPGDARSFDALDSLIDDQIYRLAYWRVASEEINYRRFFDVTELAGIRVEDPSVFEYVHRLIFDWVRQGGVHGLRIDHPDGLADPLGYFERLQERLFLLACEERLANLDPDASWDELITPVRELYRQSVASSPSGTLARRFPIVVEKILSTGEKLPSEWPIDGTVGYEYLNAANGLFVDPDASTALESLYREFSGDRDPFAEALHDSKLYVEKALLASELNTLVSQLNKVASRGRQSRDFTLNDLRRVLVEVVACFRVYRTYLRPGEDVSSRDREYIEQAVARARRRVPTVDRSVFDFVRDALLLQIPADLPDEAREQWEQFVIRFQQTTGPVQAKGLEDTLFYRQFPLVSLNEVGGDPSRWATSPSAYHALNLSRLSDWPGGLTPSATHDTKRGEDARVRIDAISELVDEWKIRLARWSRWNSRKKVRVNETDCPDSREEYLLYQTLVGVWPLEAPEASVPSDLVERVTAYMVKAACEAKRNTTWTDPDSTYKETLARVIGEILSGEDARPFLDDFLQFQRRVARIGIVNSLSQVVLKMVAPGVTDIYQGCELWDFSMVDPDNRRPVDFDRRALLLDGFERELAAGATRHDLARQLLANPCDGAIKLYVIWTALQERSERPELYQKGTYRGLDTAGIHKDRVIAIQRVLNGTQAIAVVPRLVAPLMGEGSESWPVGRACWQDTEVVVPEPAQERWRDLFTGQTLSLKTLGDRRVLAVADLLGELPVAFLVPEFAPQ